jgi:hypothetical protein
MMSTLDRLRGRVDGGLKADAVRAFAVADRERALDGLMARYRVIEHQVRMYALAVYNRAQKSPTLAAIINRAMADDAQRRRTAQLDRLIRAEIVRQLAALAEAYQRQTPAVDFSDLFQKSNPIPHFGSENSQ